MPQPSAHADVTSDRQIDQPDRGFEGSRQWLAGSPLQALAPALDKWFHENLQRVYAPVRNAQDDFFIQLLATLRI